MNAISLSQLEYIVAVDTHRHFVTAAEACFITQPTLSMQIRKLEEQLGIVIFDRSKHPIIPTDVGQAVIEQARTIIQESKKIEEIVLNFQNQVSGELRVGIIPTLAPYLVPLFVGAFTKQYPEVKLTIKELLTHQIIEDLRKDFLDAGIMATPLGEAGVIEEKMFTEKIKFYVNSGSKLIDLDEVSLENLTKEKVWFLADGHCFQSQMINLCQIKEQRNEAFEYTSGSLEALKRIVDEEGGITLLPELATLDFDSTQSKQLKGWREFVPLREISMVYTRYYTKKRLLNCFKEAVLGAVPQNVLDETDGRVVEWKTNS